MREIDFSELLEMLTFALALALYGWSADRSHELLTFVGFAVAMTMFTVSLERRGN